MLIAIFAVSCLLVGLYFLAHYNIWRPVQDKAFPRILMYHSINADSEGVPADLVVHPQRFEQQLRYLQRHGYHFATVSEIVAGTVPAPAVALTFDDGFEDNYLQMFPLLQRYQAKATVYLSPEIAGIKRLSTEQIRTMHASGLVEFGAHTMTHLNLAKADPATAEQEIKTSQAHVSALLGAPCVAFAYPYGRFDEAAVALVKQYGFTSAVTVKKGIEALADHFRIKRVSVLGKTNMLQFHIAITRGRYRV